MLATLYLPNMTSISMKIHNPQVFTKSSVRALKTAKNGFHVMKAICPEICTFIHHISVYFESLGTFTVMKSLYNLPVLRNSRNLNKSSYKSSKNPKNSEKIRVQSVGCVYSHRTECRQIMCSRLVNRFSSSYSVEITSKQGPAKFWR